MKIVFIWIYTIFFIVTTILLFILSEGEPYWEPFWPVLLRYAGLLSVIYFLSLLYRSLWRKYVKNRKYFGIYLIIPIIPLLLIILPEVGIIKYSDPNDCGSLSIEGYKDVVNTYPEVQIASPREDVVYKHILPIEVLFFAPECYYDLINIERVVYLLKPLGYGRDVVIEVEESPRTECVCINKEARNFLDISAIPPGKYVFTIVLHHDGRFKHDEKEVTII